MEVVLAGAESDLDCQKKTDGRLPFSVGPRVLVQDQAALLGSDCNFGRESTEPRT